MTPVPQLQARTSVIDDPGDLRRLLPAHGTAPAAAWCSADGQLIGLGEVARCEVTSMGQAEAWWQAVVADLQHTLDTDAGTGADTGGAGAGAGGTGDARLAGSGIGPLAFGSFVFDPDNTAHLSVLTVPQVIIGTRDGLAWLTRIAPVGADLPEAAVPPASPTPQPPGEITWADGAVSAVEWTSRVAEAVARIGAGELQKVVLARELVATAPDPISPRWLVEHLSQAYPRCWTFWVDDMIGATPEMLVRTDQGQVTSRVLAGTIWRGAHPRESVADILAASDKNLAEHAYAVESVAQALAPYCQDLQVPDAPFVLELPNVMHLATDVHATVREGHTSLILAEALHPSAAVCGTPTDDARAMIAQLEGLDRGRYSGTVGWVDAHGNGEWAIALRCGRLEQDRHTMRLFAGCGIMATSDPALELAESNAKLVPMRDALESAAPHENR